MPIYIPPRYRTYYYSNLPPFQHMDRGPLPASLPRWAGVSAKFVADLVIPYAASSRREGNGKFSSAYVWERHGVLAALPIDLPRGTLKQNCRKYSLPHGVGVQSMVGKYRCGRCLRMIS